MSNYVCSLCGKDTSNVDIDYLVGVDHLVCHLEKEQKEREGDYEVCVLCGGTTSYTRNTHIDMRVGYIEGAGQLCTKCWTKGTDRNHMTVPESLVYNTPNDQELGAAVRKLYYENKQ